MGSLRQTGRRPYVVAGRGRQDGMVQVQEGSLGGRQGDVGFGYVGRGACVACCGPAFVGCSSRSRGRQRERVTGGAAGSVPTSKVRERKTLAGLLRAYRPTRKRKRKECWRGCRERTGQQNKGERRCWRGCGELTGQQREKEKEMLAGLRRAYRPAEKE